MRLSLFPTLMLALSVGPASAQYLPAGAEQWYLRTDDGVRHYVVEVGDAEAVGDTVIVLHGGFGADHSYLFDAVLPLADRYRFVLYDQRGSLRSPAPDSTISLDRLVADLDALRDDLGLDRVTLLGHSMGTALAYTYLAAHPDRVTNLVLTGPAFPFWPAVAPDYEMMDALGVARTDTTFMADYMSRYTRKQEEVQARAEAERAEEGLDGPAQNGREQTEKWRIGFASANLYHVERWRQVTGGQVFYNGDVYRALVAAEGGNGRYRERWAPLYPALRAYEGPLTFIVGIQDFIDPGAELWPSVAGLFDQSELVLIDEAGHNVWIDQPEQFESALRDALNRVGSVPAR